MENVDLVARTTPAYLDLWRFLGSIDLIDQVTWAEAPVDDPLALRLAVEDHLQQIGMQAEEAEQVAQRLIGGEAETAKPGEPVTMPAPAALPLAVPGQRGRHRLAGHLRVGGRTRR